MIFLPELEMTLTDLLFYFHKGKEGDHDLPLSLSHPYSLPLPPRAAPRQAGIWFSVNSRSHGAPFLRQATDPLDC